MTETENTLRADGWSQAYQKKDQKKTGIRLMLTDSLVLCRERESAPFRGSDIGAPFSHSLPSTG